MTPPLVSPPGRYVLGLLDGGLTLPSPRMYTSTAPRDAKLRAGFHEVIQKVLELTGLPAVHAKAVRHPKP